MMHNRHFMHRGQCSGNLAYMHYTSLPMELTLVITHLILCCIFLGLGKRQDASIHVKARISRLLISKIQSRTHVAPVTPVVIYYTHIIKFQLFCQSSAVGAHMFICDVQPLLRLWSTLQVQAFYCTYVIDQCLPSRCWICLKALDCSRPLVRTRRHSVFPWSGRGPSTGSNNYKS